MKTFDPGWLTVWRCALRKLSGPDAVLWAGRVDDEVDLEELELTGVPE